MLILRRKAGETLLVGDEVKITVMDVYEGGVRLAIDAPKRITILRSELLQAADANRDAAKESAKPQELFKYLNGKPAAGQKKAEEKTCKSGTEAEGQQS